MKLLVIDDEPDILTLLSHFLGGQEREVITAASGPEGLKRFEAERPDLVILDVMMPGMDGWTVLARLREQGARVPVILLTAKDTPTDVAKGLMAGADDYIAKPFDLAELEARIAAVMRRYAPEDRAPQRYEVGDLVIDDQAKTVTLAGEPLNLSPKAYELLKLLAREPGRVFSQREIVRHVWRERDRVSPNDVSKYVMFLREQIEEDPHRPKRLLTVRGFGYKLVP